MSGNADSDLQKQIEEIDTQLYNLLMKRTELVEKQPTNPIENSLGQEAAAIKRMLRNHQGEFPEYVIAKIWREILSASACLKSKLKFSVYAKDSDDIVIQIMQEHFGSYLDYVTYNSFGAVMKELGDHEAQLAIIPCDDAEMNAKPWWAGFSASNTSESLKIVAKLPFIRCKEDNDIPEVYVVALSPTDQSGSDISLLGVEVAKDVSASSIVDSFENNGFQNAKVLNTVAADDEKFCLVETNGYITPEDKRYQAIEGLFKKLNIVGTYAKPVWL